MKKESMRHLSRVLLLVFALISLSACGASSEQADAGQNASVSIDESQENQEGETVNIGSFTTTDFAGNEVKEDIFKENKLTMVNVFSVG